STSVHAVSPGHTNHAGDVIPPFTYVKDGETMQFAGQNWDAAAAALLDSGCRRAAGSGIAASGTTAAREAVESSTASGVEGAFAERSASRTDEGVLDAILPDTGGARLGLLVLGVGLVAAGGWLVSRRPRTA
ncbi:MAG: LPXTG cell wall anchor domain-containing protein, partial [Aeromicrobium sp.]